MKPRLAEHDQLRESMSRYAVLLRASGLTDQTALLKERVQFAQIFAAHLKSEHSEVVGLAGTDPTITATSARRGDMLSQLRSDYSIHVRHWTPATIRSELAAYRTTVLALQDRLRAFMDWEEANFPIYR